MAKRLSPPAVPVPPEAVEVEYVSPLLARPAVIPVRASTPVAALRPAPERCWRGGHGDGLGALRGTVAHRAIELSFGEGERPDLAALVRSESERLLDDEVVARLVVEVSEMLDRFAGSRLAATLRDPATRSYFELPFAWDWEGVPVHGTIDLLYRDASG